MPTRTGASVQPAAAAAAPPFDRALLDKYCVTCHNDRRKASAGGLALDSIDATRIGDHPEIWEKVVSKLRSREMPPSGLPGPTRRPIRRPSPPSKPQLDRTAAAAPNPGRIAVHRMNRAQYGNAIRDLLGLEVDTQTLLRPDETGYGFDNIADVLTISPGLMEEYKLAAWKISRLAVGDPTIRPSVVDLQGVALSRSGVPRQRGPAVRHARRHGHRPHLPARRRVRAEDRRCNGPMRRTSSRA